MRQARRVRFILQGDLAGSAEPLERAGRDGVAAADRRAPHLPHLVPQLRLLCFFLDLQARETEYRDQEGFLSNRSSVEVGKLGSGRSDIDG